jgi:hypothetical protein
VSNVGVLVEGGYADGKGKEGSEEGHNEEKRQEEKEVATSLSVPVGHTAAADRLNLLSGR